MPTDSTAADAFEAVEADPDAILEECDAATPTELVESGGKHEPCLEDDVDDVTAAELFADLGDEVADSNREDETDAAGETDATDETDAAADADGGSDRVADLSFEFVGDAAVTVRDDGDVIDTTAAELDALTATDPDSTVATDDDAADGAAAADADTDTGSSDAATPGTLTLTAGPTDELELVGPAPTTTRVTNDTFGSAPSDVFGSPPTDAR